MSEKGLYQVFFSNCRFFFFFFFFLGGGGMLKIPDIFGGYFFFGGGVQSRCLGPAYAGIGKISEFPHPLGI